MSKLTIKTNSFLEGNKLHLESLIETDITKAVNTLQKKIIDFEEKSVREALITLGWIPPNSENYPITPFPGWIIIIDKNDVAHHIPKGGYLSDIFSVLNEALWTISRSLPGAVVIQQKIKKILLEAGKLSNKQ